VLPGTECLAQAEIDVLKKFVARGGCLILIGAAGKYDGWRRQWPTDPFAGLKAGKGKVIRLPALELPESAPPLAQRVVWDDFYRVIDGRFWLLPRNAGVLLDALKKDLGQLMPFAVRAPGTTFIEPRMMEDGTMLIHIIHCDPKCQKQKLAFTLAATAGIRRISWVSPGRKEQNLPFKAVGKKLTFTLATNATYGLIKLK